MLDTRSPLIARRQDRDAVERLTRLRTALTRMAQEMGALKREHHALRREVQRLRRENVLLRATRDEPDAPTGD